MFLDVLRDLVAGVQARAGIGGQFCGQRPDFAPRAVARRLAAGLRVVEAYLRRLLIVLALALEPTLVDGPKPVCGLMRRPHGRKSQAGPPRFIVLEAAFAPRLVDHATPDRWEELGLRQPASQAEARARAWTQAGSDTPVAGTCPMAGLYRRLDLLVAITADPARRARRLAFHLARNRPGRIFAPDGGGRPPRFASQQTSLSYSAMAQDIDQRSRYRPPPLPPRRRAGPSVLVLDG